MVDHPLYPDRSRVGLVLRQVVGAAGTRRLAIAAEVVAVVLAVLALSGCSSPSVYRDARLATIAGLTIAEADYDEATSLQLIAEDAHELASSALPDEFEPAAIWSMAYQSLVVTLEAMDSPRTDAITLILGRVGLLVFGASAPDPLPEPTERIRNDFLDALRGVRDGAGKYLELLTPPEPEPTPEVPA